MGKGRLVGCLIVFTLVAAGLFVYRQARAPRQPVELLHDGVPQDVDEQLTVMEADVSSGRAPSRQAILSVLLSIEEQQVLRQHMRKSDREIVCRFLRLLRASLLLDKTMEFRATVAAGAQYVLGQLHAMEQLKSNPESLAAQAEQSVARAIHRTSCP